MLKIKCPKCSDVYEVKEVNDNLVNCYNCGEEYLQINNLIEAYCGIMYNWVYKLMNSIKFYGKL